MNSRGLLAFCALALFLPTAGCAAGLVQLTDVNDTELARHASHDLPASRIDEEVDRRGLVTTASATPSGSNGRR